MHQQPRELLPCSLLLVGWAVGCIQGAWPGEDGFPRAGHPALALGHSGLRERTTARSGIGPQSQQKREGSSLIEGSVWATRTSWVGRAAEGDAARKFVPLGLSETGSSETVSRGHRPNCKSGGTGGKNETEWNGGIPSPVMAKCSKQRGKEAKPQVVTEGDKIWRSRRGGGWELSHLLRLGY